LILAQENWFDIEAAAKVKVKTIASVSSVLHPYLLWTDRLTDLPQNLFVFFPSSSFLQQSPLFGL